MTRKQFLALLAGGLLGGIVARLHAQTAPEVARPITHDQQKLDRALIYAIRRLNTRDVLSLLDRGADPNARDVGAKPNRNGRVEPPRVKEPPSALLVVFDNARRITGRNKQGDVLYSVRPQPTEIVRVLLERGAKADALDYDGTFPLFKAAECKYTECVRLLLKHGADPNRSWVHGITSLHNAVSNKDVKTAQVLLESGADPDARSAFDNPQHPLRAELRQLFQQAGISVSGITQ